jgi:hypothetical protein
MNLSYRKRHEGQVETLKLTSDPLYYGLGNYKDTEGRLWDVVCVIGGMHTENGKPYINARLVDGSPYYSTGSDSNQDGHHSWKPYYFEVVNEKE